MKSAFLSVTLVTILLNSVSTDAKDKVDRSTAAFDPNATYNWYAIKKFKGIRVESGTFYWFDLSGLTHQTKGEEVEKPFLALCPSVAKQSGQVAHGLLMKAFMDPAFKLEISVGMENQRWGSGVKPQECISVVKTVTE